MFKTRLSTLRRSCGLTQAETARRAGISRQAFRAIEADGAVPATDTALRLARALGVTVEALFHLEPDDAAPHAAPPHRVRTCNVRQTQVEVPVTSGRAFLPADAVVAPDGRRVHLRDGDDTTLIVAGCDPAVGVVASRHPGIDLLWVEAGSRASLERLARREAHVAGCHLHHPATGRYNRPFVDALLPFPCTLVSFATWAQGLITAPGNPLDLRRVEDLARPGVRLVNREAGSGSRALLDDHLALAGVPAGAVSGYDTNARGHLAVADAIAAGLADVGVGIAAAAAAHGLGFVALAHEPYDLVVPDDLLDTPQVGALLDALRAPTARRQVEALGGYDASAMGAPA